MNIDSYGQTDIGRKRKRNEDAFLADPQSGLFAVADGLGGMAAGDQASMLAVEALGEGFSGAANNGGSVDFRTFFKTAHSRIRELGSTLSSDRGKGAGTTLTAALLKDYTISLAHVGDSAAYCFHQDDWKKLTIDHTMAEELRQDHPEDVIPEIFEHTLTRCLGQAEEPEVDLLTHPLSSGQRLLLCSDGVTRSIDPEEIHDRIILAKTAQEFVEDIIALANERGGVDNATAIAIFIQ